MWKQRSPSWRTRKECSRKRCRLKQRSASGNFSCTCVLLAPLLFGGSLRVRRLFSLQKLLRIEREQERTSTAMREALDAALQEKARLITDLDIYNEQLSANEALRELLMMAKIEPLELPRTAP